MENLKIQEKIRISIVDIYSKYDLFLKQNFYKY